jgi:hypothetical protein
VIPIAAVCLNPPLKISPTKIGDANAITNSVGLGVDDGVGVGVGTDVVPADGLGAGVFPPEVLVVAD